MYSRILPIAGVIATLATPSVKAEQVEPIVVTASRTAQTTDETLAPVTVITRQDIERKQAETLIDVVRGLPGIQLSNNGGPGQLTTFFLRGTESDHVLVMIDGVKVGSATAGITQFQDIPVDQIEKIEIVRGPKSSLYGSEAIGGVIHIFTRKGVNGLTPYASITAGSHHYASVNAGLTGGNKNHWYALNVTGTRSDDEDSCRKEAATEFGGCFVDEPDDDGYNKQSISARFGFRIDENGEINISWLKGWTNSDYDGTFSNHTQNSIQVFSANLRYDLSDHWTSSISWGLNDDKTRTDANGTFAGRTDTRRHTLSFQNDLDFEEWGLITLGVDRSQDEVDATTVYSEDSRHNLGFFAQWLGQFENQQWQASLRRDINEQFGNQTTGNISLGFDLPENLRFTASVGSAFKAPTFNDLYWPFQNFGFSTYQGNPDLRPERSHTIEFSLSSKRRWGAWGINLYRTDIKNLIDGYVCDMAFNCAPDNVSEASIDGMELQLATRIYGWQMNTVINALDPRDRSGGANDGNLLPRRAQATMNVDIDRRFGKWSVGTTFYAEGDRYNDAANTRLLEDYTLVHLRASYQFAKDWSLQAKIENLFDTEYETTEYYNQPGTSVFVTLRYNPGT